LAHHKSAIKRIKQSEKKKQRNMHVKSTVRSYIKLFREDLEKGEVDSARTSLATASRQISKAVSKGVYHQRNGARKISRMTRAFNKFAQTPAQ